MNVRNLVLLFERSAPAETLQTERRSSVEKRSSIKAVFVQSQEKESNHDTHLQQESSALESKVSVRSLVYNFQKLVEQSKPEQDNYRIRSHRRGSDSKGKRESSIVQSAPHSHTSVPASSTDVEETKTYDVNRFPSTTSEPSCTYITTQKSLVENTVINKCYEDKSSVFQQENITTDLKPIEATTNFVSSVPVVKSDSLSRESEKDDDLSEESDDNEPLTDIISPLPNSYEVLSFEKGHLDLKLPSPPKKSCLKTAKTKRNKNVNFTGKTPDIFETYNMYEYSRADEDLDILASTAEYEFEKATEGWDRHEVTVTKKQGQRLGLQVYGMGMRKPNSKDCLAIYVKGITPDSPCAQSQNIYEDDLILELNGVSLLGVSIPIVNDAIRGSGDQIKIVLARDPNGQNTIDSK